MSLLTDITYAWWNTEEYLTLVEWMRAYNVRYPRDQLRFMGDDFAYADPELYDEVLGTRPGTCPTCCRVSPRCTGGCDPPRRRART